MHIYSERRQQEARVTDWGPRDGDDECWVPGSFLVPAALPAFGCWEIHRDMPCLSNKSPFTPCGLTRQLEFQTFHFP